MFQQQPGIFYASRKFFCSFLNLFLSAWASVMRRFMITVITIIAAAKILKIILYEPKRSNQAFVSIEPKHIPSCTTPTIIPMILA